MSRLRDFIVRLVPRSLKGGERVRFPDGKVYEKQTCGALVRVSPIKPWSNKAERKRWIRQRRRNRELLTGMGGESHRDHRGHRGTEVLTTDDTDGHRWGNLQKGTKGTKRDELLTAGAGPKSAHARE